MIKVHANRIQKAITSNQTTAFRQKIKDGLNSAGLLKLNKAKDFNYVTGDFSSLIAVMILKGINITKKTGELSNNLSLNILKNPVVGPFIKSF